jgi:hypothetical protein
MNNHHKKPNKMPDIRGISESKLAFIFMGLTLICITIVTLYGVYIQTDLKHPLVRADLFFDTMYSGVVVSLIGGVGGYALATTSIRRTALKKEKKMMMDKQLSHHLTSQNDQ